MIFLIMHVKFPGWTKDKNQKFQRFMSPFKTSQKAPATWWCIANHPVRPDSQTSISAEKSHEAWTYWWRFRYNSEFRFLSRAVFVGENDSDIGLSICTWSAMDGVRDWFWFVRENLLQTCKKAWICSNFPKYIDVKRVFLQSSKESHPSVQKCPLVFLSPVSVVMSSELFSLKIYIDIWYNWHNHKSEICPRSPNWKSFQPRWRQHFNRHFYASELQDWTAIQHY